MRVRQFVFLWLFVTGSLYAAAPHFGDLAVLLAKGWFKNYVRSDASMEECVVFLNSKGICFSLFDLMDPDVVVTKEDLARVVGQSKLLFWNEAKIENGCIKKPLEGDSWVDWCVLNDIQIDSIWGHLLQRTEYGSLVEVRTFFGNERAGIGE